MCESCTAMVDAMVDPMVMQMLLGQAKLASIAAPCVLFAGVLPRYIFYGSNRHEAPR